MKSRKIGFISSVLLCFVLNLILISGCGSSDSSSLSGTVALFDQAREVLKTATSFRMTGEGNVTYSYENQSVPTNFSYEVFFEHKEGKEPLMKMVLGIIQQDSGIPSGFSDEMKIDVYMTGDRMYMQDPTTGQWYYEEINIGEEFSQIGQGFSPQSVVDLVESAETVEIIDDTKSHTQYKLKINADALYEGAKLEEAKSSMESEGFSEEEIAMNLEMVKELAAIMDITVKVNKESGLIDEFEVRFGENMLDYIPPSAFEDDPPPEGSSVTMHMNYRISDYGKDFDLELPKETENAEPMDAW